jgi:hypothetical protein
VSGPVEATVAPCLEWAWAGRPLPGEDVSGDLALARPVAGGALLAVIDGLGHGAEAAEVAARAREVVAAHAGAPLDELLATAHAALHRTRGVTASLATVSCAGVLTWVGVGNVESHVLRPEAGGLRREASAVLYGGVVGYRLPPVRVTVVELVPGDLVVMATDGITRDFPDQVPGTGTVARIAATVLERCASPGDDALVAVARYRGPGA